MLVRTVRDFLTLRLEKGAKLLLGFSGGPDSMALLHALKECQENLDFSLHVAHIDHGWREESGREAKALRQVAKHLKVPFHLKRLEKMTGGDLENKGRKERLSFFAELQEKEGFQAVLLAHHLGDQGETVFKRVAEGAGVHGLGGLFPERKIGKVLIWRPLLKTQKKEIFAYLKKKKLHYFDDKTNVDPRFLRSRMRTSLFPELEKIFGKRMEKNFARLGTLCQEISHYFEEKGEKIREKLVTGPFGSYLDLKDIDSILELKFFLKNAYPISHDALEVLIKLIRQGHSSRQVVASPYSFHLSRSYLFIVDLRHHSFFDAPECWTAEGSGDWKTFFQGKIRKEGAGKWISIDALTPLLRRKLKKWYSSHKVPLFFFEKAPLLLTPSGEVQECLTFSSDKKFKL